MLKKLKQNINTRQLNFNKQTKFFNKHKNFFLNPIETKGVNTSWLAFPILISEDAPFKRKDFQIYLEKRNIQTRVVFTGNILRQPMCEGIEKRVTPNGLNHADEVMKRGVLLPVHHGMTNEMFNRLHETIEDFIGQF